MINAGDLERADVRVGESRPQKVMLGDTQIWPPPRETRIHLHVDTEWSADYSPGENDSNYIVDFGDGNATVVKGTLSAHHDYAPGDYVLRRLTEDGRMQSTFCNINGNMFGNGPGKADEATEQVVGIEIGGEVTYMWGTYLAGLPNLRIVTIPASVGRAEDSLFMGSGIVYAEIGFRRHVQGATDGPLFKDCAELRKIWIRATTEYLGPKFIGELHDGLTVYCEADSKPAGWDADWNLVGEARVPVVWGQKRRPW